MDFLAVRVLLALLAQQARKEQLDLPVPQEGRALRAHRGWMALKVLRVIPDQRDRLEHRAQRVRREPRGRWERLESPGRRVWMASKGRRETVARQVRQGRREPLAQQAPQEQRAPRARVALRDSMVLRAQWVTVVQQAPPVPRALRVQERQVPQALREQLV